MGRHRDKGEGKMGGGNINVGGGGTGSIDAFVCSSVLSWKLPRAQDALQGEITWPQRSQSPLLQVTDL